MSVNHECKAFQVWCTQEERNVDNFFAIVDELAKKHNINPKYKHVIFTSGRQDLAVLTGDLLKRNRDILP